MMNNRSFMDFLKSRQLLEIVELKKPNKPRKSTVIVNPGTNTARSVLQFSWKTSFGNVVKLRLDKNDEDNYDVLFYVNDKLDEEERTARDPEILSGVFYMLRNKADSMKLNVLDMKSHKNSKDYKTVFNMTGKEIYKEKLIEPLRSLYQNLKNNQPKILIPTASTINLHKKLGWEPPTPEPEYDENYIDNIRKLGGRINDAAKDVSERVFENIKDVGISFLNREFTKRLGFDYQSFEKNFKYYELILDSETERGTLVYKNRRQNIYIKLFNRYFPDWDLLVRGDYLTLTRKNPI